MKTFIKILLFALFGFLSYGTAKASTPVDSVINWKKQATKLNTDLNTFLNAKIYNALNNVTTVSKDSITSWKKQAVKLNTDLNTYLTALIMSRTGAYPAGVTAALTGSGTAGYVPVYLNANTFTVSNIYHASGRVGIGTGTVTPSSPFEVAGYLKINDALNCTQFGKNALSSLTSGTQNSAFSRNCLSSLTTANYNSFYGVNSGVSLVDGDINVGFGLYALGSLVHGTENTAVGSFAGLNALGNGNVFLGFSAGKNETGSGKLYIDNSPTTTPLIGGDFNTRSLTFTVSHFKMALPTSSVGLSSGEWYQSGLQILVVP